MEDILDVYQRGYNPNKPVVCTDEKPYQLLADVYEPLPTKCGSDKKQDAEYKKNGTCSIFSFVEPLGGMHYAKARKQRTASDWAEEIKYLVDELYAHVDKVVLVMDNLNTHAIASLYKGYSPAEANRIAKKLEIHYTPKHGSWLNIAEIELNAMTRQCLNRRIESIDILNKELAAWLKNRNSSAATVDWQFTTQDARIKLKRLYPIYRQ